MLVVTTDNLPGYEIREVLGEVIGVNARTHNPFAEGVKSLHGGTNPRMTEALIRWREEAVERMAQIAQRRGANAVVAMRFDHREITTAWVEICAYGTAVVVSYLANGHRTPVVTGGAAGGPRTAPVDGPAADPEQGPRPYPRGRPTR
ncbi:MAG TPA: YbjQ family protein [Pilimelia sp.]|nr:YbjQ family protein [Pilimelia sp.]